MAMAARSRSPLMSGYLLTPPPCFLGIFTLRVTGMESSSFRICPASRIGVMPICRLNLGPLTNIAGLSGTTCLITSQLNRPRSAARCCLTDGAVRACARYRPRHAADGW